MKKTAVKYKVVEEKIDLEALRQEKERIEGVLAMPEPTEKELVEIGKTHHPYFMDKTDIQNRLNQINSILGVK